MISVFRSFEIFLSWRLIVVERLRDGFLELVRLEEFLVVVFLAICLNRNIVLIIACVLFSFWRTYFLHLRRKPAKRAAATVDPASTISIKRKDIISGTSTTASDTSSNDLIIP